MLLRELDGSSVESDGRVEVGRGEEIGLRLGLGLGGRLVGRTVEQRADRAEIDEQTTGRLRQRDGRVIHAMVVEHMGALRAQDLQQINHFH